MSTTLYPSAPVLDGVGDGALRDLGRPLVQDFRLGPDDLDPANWSELSEQRRMWLLLTGTGNDKMQSYVNQIRQKPARMRSQPEQWTVVSRTFQEIMSEAPPPPCQASTRPGPVWWNFALWGAAATLLVIGLLVFVSYQRGWRQPFGKRRLD